MNMSLGTILMVILILLLLGALPTWPYSAGWGYYPSGGLGLFGQGPTETNIKPLDAPSHVTESVTTAISVAVNNLSQFSDHLEYCEQVQNHYGNNLILQPCAK